LNSYKQTNGPFLSQKIILHYGLLNFSGKWDVKKIEFKYIDGATHLKMLAGG